jgi:hypothetical protein
MNKPFKFSAAQRADIEAPLLRRGHDAARCRQYVKLAETEITEWQRRWPPVDAARLADNRRHLKQVEKHLTQLHYDLSALGEDWQVPLWARLHDRTGERMHLLLIDMRHVVSEQIEAGADLNSRMTMRKVELVKGLAASYRGLFDKMPTTTPSGAFMQIMTAVGAALGEPIGKDATATGLTEWRRDREFHFEVAPD